MSVRTRLAAAVTTFVLALLATACTTTLDFGSSPTPEVSAPRSPESPSPVPTGTGSAAAAMKALCEHTSSGGSSAVTAEGPTPPAIAQVEKQVEELRGLSFTQPVAVDAVTHAELVKGLEKSFDTSFPRALYERRSLAWQTIGVIPKGTDIRRALEEFNSGQVIGYYDTLSKELVFMGSNAPTAMEKVTLAHELTHALDDQTFGLSRIDHLGNTCQDEAYDAAVGAVEGDATYFMTQYALKDLTLEEQLQLGTEAGTAPSTASIPPFIVQMQEWPYMAGMDFVTALEARGGVKAVDQALTDLPTSTEQIIHPETYPNDVPQPVDIPDLGPRLGSEWSDLDVQQVGEEFLSIMLALRLDQGTADEASAGWGGGIYRAWRNGAAVAVVLSTVWDTTTDATQFADAMQGWIDAGNGQSATVLPVQGNRVEVLFGSDAQTLSALEAAAG
jgi:hypothetical protein